MGVRGAASRRSPAPSGLLFVDRGEPLIRFHRGSSLGAATDDALQRLGIPARRGIHAWQLEDMVR